MTPLNPRRNKAFLIDVIIYLGLILFPFCLTGILPAWLAGKAFVVGLSLGITYIIFRDGVQGQSIGKRIYGIQLIHKNSREPIGFGIAFCRGVLTSLPILGWIDFLQTTFTANRQRISDRMLGLELVIAPSSREG